MWKNCFFYVGIFFLLAGSSCQKGGGASLQLVIPNGNNWQVSVNGSGHAQKVVFDEADSAMVVFPGVQREYVNLQMGRRRYPLYVERGKELCVRIGVEQGTLKLFFDGDLAKINSYLEQTGRIYLNRTDFGLNLQDYRKRLAQLLQEQEQVLEEYGFDRAFTALEKKRLRYKNQMWYTLYPIERRDCTRREEEMTDFCKGLRQQIVEREADIVIPEYIEMISLSIRQLVKYQQTYTTSEEEMRLLVQYVDRYIENNRIAERLLTAWVFPYMAQNNWTDRTMVDKIMEKRLVDSVYILEYDSLCNRWDRLLPGKPMLNFCFEDREGKKVSLTDLWGKYVYIDMWATWCIPCWEELPYMKQLEEKFVGRNIHFVSISVDRDKKAWERKVVQDQLKGIQLYAGRDQSLMDFLNSTAIPRFILVDPAGYIIQADMSRPSNPETTKYIDALEEL